MSEIYLLAAEALMNQRKTDEAVICLNELRSRSHASEIDASDVILDFILKERSSELIVEAYSGHTLVRTGKFYEWTLKYNLRLDVTKVNTWIYYLSLNA